MAVRYFPGKSQEWLEAKLDRVLEDLARGQRFTDTESAGVRGRKESVLSADEVRSRLLYDLSIIDPTTYPPADVTRTSRTKAVAYTTPPRFNG